MKQTGEESSKKGCREKFQKHACSDYASTVHEAENQTVSKTQRHLAKRFQDSSSSFSAAIHIDYI